MSNERVLTSEIAEQFLANEDPVDLAEFTAIELPAATCLSLHDGWKLDLNGLSELSDAAAESLSRHVCHARNGRVGVQLHQLPDAAARILRDAGHG